MLFYKLHIFYIIWKDISNHIVETPDLGPILDFSDQCDNDPQATTTKFIIELIDIIT